MDSNLIEEDDIQTESMSLDDIKHGSLELNERTTRLELKNGKLSELPPSPNCPLLRVLSLQGNADLMEIPSSFFDCLPLLHTLDLSYTSITDLPGSLFGLMELRVLRLRGCELFMELPPETGQLKKLEELDLNETQITHVPTEIQELINLKKLSLCFYEYDQNISQVIPKGLISELTQLSYLSIDVNPDHSKWDETVRVILQEIAGLRDLRTLILYVPTVELLKYIPERGDLDFKLVVGHHMQRIISRVPPIVEENFQQSNRSLRFVYGGNSVNIPQEIKMILRSAKTFFLDRHLTIKHLTEFGWKNLGQLQVCILAECNEMQTVLKEGCQQDDALQRLQVLSLFYMKNLRGVWEGGSTHSLLSVRLKSLTLHTCPNLTTVFTWDFILRLRNLEELLVQDCPKVTTLITHKSIGFSEHLLPSIRKISLLYLPELVSIFSGLQIASNLEKIGLYYCPKLKNILTRELCSKRLKVIKGEIEWWKALRWSDPMREQNLKDVFSPIDEEVDIMTQFVIDVDEYSIYKNVEIHAPFGMTHQQVTIKESLDYPHSEQRLQSSSLNVEKPAVDGYIWRKYGLKQCIVSKFSRSYYKCTHPNCPVKKKVERSIDGHITEIIYKGQHNHQLPQSNEHTQDTLASNENSGLHGILDETSQVQSESLNRLKDVISFHSMAKLEPESSLSTAEHLSGSDSEEVCDPEPEVEEKNDEPDPKRRNTEARVPEPASSHRTVTPKIIVHTKTEVDIFEDGYRWRQYRLEKVKGDSYSRRYYECKTRGCNVRKQVERASKNPKVLITTYEGKHNHDVLAAESKSLLRFLPFKVDAILGMSEQKEW